jgi:hypothetical protein
MKPAPWTSTQDSVPKLFSLDMNPGAYARALTSFTNPTALVRKPCPLKLSPRHVVPQKKWTLHKEDFGKQTFILFRVPHFCVFLIPVHTVGVLVYSCVEWCSNIVSQRLVWFPLLVGAVSKSLIKHSGNVFIKVINKRCTAYIVWSNFIPMDIITLTSVQYLL